MTSRLYEPPSVKEAKKEESRQKFFQESKFSPTKQRYGLFSFTGTLAISDDSYQKSRKVQRDQDGAVKVGPRNFYTSPSKKGNFGSAYFSTPLGLSSIGDKYTDPVNPLKAERERAAKMRSVHESPFKTSPVRETTKAPYEHKSDLSSSPKRVRRDQDGNVITSPPNFKVSPSKSDSPYRSPGALFSATPPYMEDPYDRKKELARKEQIESMKKIEVAFRYSSPGKPTFSNDKEIYGQGEIRSKSTMPTLPRNYAQHERPFMPASPNKKGLVGTFDKYPEYMASPEKEKMRRSVKEEVPWRTTYKGISKPSPSIVSSKLNLRKESPTLRMMR